MANSEVLAPEARLQLWAETLKSLAEPDKCRQLILALNEGDQGRLEALLEPTRIWQLGACVDIVETLTKVVNFGPGHWEERCTVIARLRLHDPSPVGGKVYQFPDGPLVYVTDAEWWSYYDRAWQDPKWLAQNRGFLRALGIISCTRDWVSDSSVVTIERTRTICF